MGDLAAASGLQDRLQVAFAEDVGGIEVLYASFRNHRFDAHFHEGFSIGVALRGGLAFDQGGSKHVASSGVISALNPGEVHNSYPAGNNGWAFICFLIPIEVFRTVVTDVAERDRIPEFRDRVINDSALVQHLIHLHNVLQASPDQLARQSLCLSTFTRLIQRHSTVNLGAQPNRRERAAVRRAREFLQGSYLRPVSLMELANIAGLSRFHLLRAFRSEVGLPPHVYLNHLRVNEAKRQLADGWTIAEAAANCGFVDQSHLTRRFKQLLGFTPGQYQVACNLKFPTH